MSIYLSCTGRVGSSHEGIQIFEAAQNLKQDLSSLLDSASDGCVPPEKWEAKTQNLELFRGMLQAVLENRDPDEPIRDENDLGDIWPSDLPAE